MKNNILNGKTMKTAAGFIARRLVMTLLALFISTVAFGQMRGSGTEADPYLINSAADWATFTQNVNDGVNTKAFYKLTSDLVLGTDEQPLTTVVGCTAKMFRGVFDGDFHTIHINMVRHENFAALFGVIGGVTIKNLRVDGTITTDHKFAGGIAAYANNNSVPTNIINCISSVDIICDSIVTIDSNKPFDCTHGGLLGQNEKGITNFENCIFDGTITDSKAVKTANKCTGFVGWVNNTVTYTDCAMAGVIDVKPNNTTLKNSMANYHRLGNGAKGLFYGHCYYIHDYTYTGLSVQGEAALTTLPENTISKLYTYGDSQYYIPGSIIIGNEVIYHGWRLVEGSDILINLTGIGSEESVTISGINHYAGSFVRVSGKYIQKEVTAWNATKQSGWYAISSPIGGQTFAGVTNMTAAIHNIYRYDEKTRSWQEYRYKSHVFNEFENGRGYLYRTLDNGGVIEFNGTFNTGDVSYTLSMTDKHDDMNGFNLIGNPYSHNIYKGVAIPDGNLAEGYYILETNGTWILKSENDAITPTTAILVQALEPCTITMTDTDAAPGTKASFDNIWFTVKNSQFNDVACVEFKEGHGCNKMAHYNEDAPMLYVIDNGKNFALATMSSNEKIINLGFKAGELGKYTLSLKTEGVFNYLHLIDKVTGKDIDMLVEEEYSFIGSDSDDEDRFVVCLEPSVNLEQHENCVFAYQEGDNIIVNGDGELQVFDVTGRLVARQDINGVGTWHAASEQIYILRLVGKDVKTQKIVLM